MNRGFASLDIILLNISRLILNKKLICLLYIYVLMIFTLNSLQEMFLIENKEYS